MTSLLQKKLNRLDRASAAVAAILTKAKRGKAGRIDSTALSLLAAEIREKNPNHIFSDPYVDMACLKKTTREILALKLEAICGHINDGRENPPWIEELIDTFEAISTLAQQELDDKELLDKITHGRQLKQGDGSIDGEAGEG